MESQTLQTRNEGQILLFCFIIKALYFCGPIAQTYNSDYRYREYVYSAVVYQKYLTRLKELIIFEPWRENYNFSQPS